jgi:4-alpha-glucanotransferase
VARKSGILLHITSLPSAYGIGDLGPQAYKFADVLAQAKQSFWQILPLNPTDTAFSSSPYHSISAFAGNPLLISPEILQKEGLLSKTDLASKPEFPDDNVDFWAVTKYKNRLFDLAYWNFKNKRDKRDYERFCQGNQSWLDDYAIFVACKAHYKDAIWIDWPKEIRDRDAEAIDKIKKELSERIEFEMFLQFIFLKQWSALKLYCHKRGVNIIGDVPIYVEHDGVDCWVNPHIFKLDENRRMLALAGVPPDYFSSTGQLWGNPVYDWQALQEARYKWWIKRLRHNFNLFDLTRIDHFRGLVDYWEVPAGANTAIKGMWVSVPVDDFFAELHRNFEDLPIVAEDLGIISDEVRAAMARYNLMGMKILMFAFGGDIFENPYFPANLVKKSIVYTGTHDNNTVKGWFENDATEEERANLFGYLEREVTQEEIASLLVNMAMMSIPDIAIIPLQDHLGLGQEARMNKPSTVQGNWKWRVSPENLSVLDIRKLRKLTESSHRA